MRPINLPPTMREFPSSPDPIEIKLVRAQIAKQESRIRLGMKISWGRTPATLNKYGPIYEIQSKVLKSALGFDLVPPEFSYEAIVRDHPERFSTETVEKANERLTNEEINATPTSDPIELENKVLEITRQKRAYPPKGVKHPVKEQTTGSKYRRDPAVVEWSLRRANGSCENCNTPGPFVKKDRVYLEVHHVIHLAMDGPDMVENTVALCPNCHRAMHGSDDKQQLVSDLYAKLSHLKP